MLISADWRPSEVRNTCLRLLWPETGPHTVPTRKEQVKYFFGQILWQIKSLSRNANVIDVSFGLPSGSKRSGMFDDHGKKREDPGNDVATMHPSCILADIDRLSRKDDGNKR